MQYSACRHIGCVVMVYECFSSVWKFLGRDRLTVCDTTALETGVLPAVDRALPFCS